MDLIYREIELENASLGRKVMHCAKRAARKILKLFA
jgi:hypothetical protein